MRHTMHLPALSDSRMTCDVLADMNDDADVLVVGVGLAMHQRRKSSTADSQGCVSAHCPECGQLWMIFRNRHCSNVKILDSLRWGNLIGKPQFYCGNLKDIFRTVI